MWRGLNVVVAFFFLGVSSVLAQESYFQETIKPKKENVGVDVRKVNDSLNFREKRKSVGTKTKRKRKLTKREQLDSLQKELNLTYSSQFEDSKKDVRELRKVVKEREEELKYINKEYRQVERKVTELEREVFECKANSRINEEKRGGAELARLLLLEVEFKKIREENKKLKRKIKEREEEVVGPLSSIFLTSQYGERIDPISKIKKFHKGVDLRANYEECFAIKEGVVKEVGFNKNNGNFIVVSHADRIDAHYLHLSKLLVKKGQLVAKGEVLGKTGNSGRSVSPHLHFAIKKNGIFINPNKYLN